MEKLNIDDLIKPNNDNDNELQSNDIIKLMTVQNLFNKDNIKSNSRIKYSQVSEITKLMLYADIFNIDFVNTIATNILELQISINGLGRKELVDLVKNVQADLPDINIKQSKKDIFR